jgi:DNA-binding NarL/FixJ family response regulator
MSVQTAVVSDHDLFCKRIVASLAGELNAVALTGETRVRLAMRASLADVAIIDYAMTDALSFCEDLASERLRIIVVDVPPHERTAIDVLAAGASGIVYSGAARTEVIRAVRAVHSGLIWAPRHVVAATWRKFQRQATTSRTTETTIANRLSARERDVFRLAAAGLGNKEIGRTLAISEATVKVHLSHIFQKLGLRSRSRLAAAYFGHNPIVVRPPAN